MSDEPRRSAAAGRRSACDRGLGGWVTLCLTSGLIAVVWMVVLPRWTSHPRVQAEIERLDERQIDPSAMFYTELEALDRVLARIDRFHRDHPGALWLPE